MRWPVNTGSLFLTISKCNHNKFTATYHVCIAIKNGWVSLRRIIVTEDRYIKFDSIITAIQVAFGVQTYFSNPNFWFNMIKLTVDKNYEIWEFCSLICRLQTTIKRFYQIHFDSKIFKIFRNIRFSGTKLKFLN